MKPAIIIDAKNTILFREQRKSAAQMNLFLHSLEKKLATQGLFPSFEAARPRLEEALSGEATPAENLRNAVSLYFGKKVEKESMISYFYSLCVPMLQSHLPHYFDPFDDLFQADDYASLAELYDVHFYYKTKNPIKRVVIQLILDKIIDIKKLHFISKPEPVRAFSQLKVQELFVISVSAESVDKLIIAPNKNLEGFDFPRQFLKMATPLIDRARRNKFEVEAHSKGSNFQVTVSLKHLRNRLSIIQGFNKGILLRSNVVIFSIYFPYDILHKQIKNRVIIDYLPLIFHFQDPLAEILPEQIDVVMMKNSMLFGELNLSKDSVMEYIKMMAGSLGRHQPLNSMLFVNSFEMAPYTFYRSLMNDLFHQTLDSPDFKKSLENDLPGYKVTAPLSASFGPSTFPEVKQRLDEIGLAPPFMMKQDVSNEKIGASAHQFIIVNSWSGLEQVFQIPNKNFSLESYIIQKIVYSKYVIKGYCIFGKILISMSNSLDFNDKSPFYMIDGSKLKDIQAKEALPEEAKIIELIFNELNKRSIGNSGIDILLDEESKTFHIIDINQSTFSWVKQASVGFFRTSAIEAFVKMREQFYETHNQPPATV